jgi:hypothetical protein
MDLGRDYSRERSSAYSAAIQTASEEIALILRAALAKKRGDAADLTGLTLKVVEVVESREKPE